MKRFARGERGAGFLGVLVILAVLAILAFVGFKFLMLRVHFASIREIVKNRAAYAVSYSDFSIKRDVRQRAWENGIDVSTDSIYVYREPGYRITIQVPFSDSVNLIVKKFYYHFTVEETAPLPR